MKQTNKKQSALLWLMQAMGKRCPIYLSAILLSTLGLAGAKVANAWIVNKIVSAAQQRQAEGVVAAVAFGFLLYVAAQLLWRFSIVRYNIEAAYAQANIEKRIFSKAMRLPYGYYERHPSGEFLSKLIYDTERTGDIYGSRLRRLLSSVISAVVYIIPMLYYSWQLTLCLFIVSCVSLGINSLFARPMKDTGKQLSGRSKRLTEQLTIMLSGMEMVKLLPSREKLLKEYQDSAQDYYSAQMKANRLWAGLESIQFIFDMSGTLFFLGLGVLFISRNLIGLGQLAAIYSLYGSFQYVFLEIGKYFPQMMQCMANAEALMEFSLGEESTVLDGSKVYEQLHQPADHAVEISHLAFSYPNGREVFRDLSLTIEKGKCVAIVGESGCGKSTLGKLLLGFYQPVAGSIQTCGEIAYVPQEPYLYQTTIAENISYGRGGGEIPMEEIIEAAKAANAHEFIMKLPKGYDTVVGERGNTLSGGEKQRIAIARAVLKAAPILLMDEATSALDNESERLVNAAVRKIGENCTVIMIAHRASTIAMAERVIELA